MYVQAGAGIVADRSENGKTGMHQQRQALGFSML